VENRTTGCGNVNRIATKSGQIRTNQEKSGNVFSIRENQREKKDVLENQGNVRATVSLFLYSALHPVECDNCQVFPLFIAIRSVMSFWSAVPYFMEPEVWTSKKSQGSFPDPRSVGRNYDNIRGNQGGMSSISRNISGKIMEFCLEIAVAILCKFKQFTRF